MKRIEKFDQIPANTDIIAGIDLIGNIKQLFSLPLQLQDLSSCCAHEEPVP